MTEVRFPGYCEGADLGGEPINWLVYDTETKERRIEPNPNYVPPAPLTELEKVEQEIADLEWELALKRSHLATLTGE